MPDALVIGGLGVRNELCQMLAHRRQDDFVVESMGDEDRLCSGLNTSSWLRVLLSIALSNMGGTTLL